MATKPNLEYVCISLSGGEVSVSPILRPDTQTAQQAGRIPGASPLIDAINKMAEYGYRVLDGTSLVTDRTLAGANVTVFMYREV